MSVELPPLPLTKSEYGFDDTPAFTADQMRAYASAAVDAALERAAQECNAQKSGLSSEWGDGHDTGCDDCYAAIRALKTKDGA